MLAMFMKEGCITGTEVLNPRPHPLRNLTETMVLPQTGSMLMYVTFVATKGYMDAQRVGHHLRPC